MTTVYKYTCVVTDKVYVGKTDGPLWMRHYHHIHSAMNGNRNAHFANAIRKHGEDSFTLEILCEVEEELGSFVEMIFIAALNSSDRRYGYNMTDGGEGMSGYRHTEEAKKSISEKMTGRPVTAEFRDKISKLKRGNTYSFGRKFTDEQRRMASDRATLQMSDPKSRANLSQRMKGNKNAAGNTNRLGMKTSEETKAKMRIAQQRRRQEEANACGRQ